MNIEEAEERFFIMKSESDINIDFIHSHFLKTYGQEITDYIFNKYEQRPANFETLSKYINAGIKLIPTKPTDTGAFYQLKKDKGTPAETLIKIDSLQGLKYWIDHDIKRFIFIPKEAGLLCIDIDRNHGDGIDGIKNFYTWLQSNGLSNIPFFKDIERGTFPTYTATANGGLHLYFRFQSELKTFSEITKGVELKYNGLSLTAGGSVKNNKSYSLHGDLLNAPYLPAPLLFRFSKLNKPAPAPQNPNKYGAFYQAKKKGEYTPEQLLNFVRNDFKGLKGHNLIKEMATRLKRAGYSEAETLGIIQNTPEHLERENKQDTLTCIHSFYK